MADGVPMADICTAIAADLPTEAQLVRIDYDRGRCSLEFDMTLSGDEDAEPPDPARMIGQWDDDPCLRQHLADLILQGSARQRTSEGPVQMLRFRCRVKTGG